MSEINSIPRPGERAKGTDISKQPSGNHVDSPPNPWVPRHQRPRFRPLVQHNQAGRILDSLPAWHSVATPKPVQAARKELEQACATLADAEEAFTGSHPDNQHAEATALREAQQAVAGAKSSYDAVVAEALEQWAPKLAQAAEERRQEAVQAVEQAAKGFQAWDAAQKGGEAAAEALHGERAWIPRPERTYSTEAFGATLSALTSDDVRLSGRYLDTVGSADVPEWVPTLLVGSAKHASRVALGLAEAKGVVSSSYIKNAVDFPQMAAHAAQISREDVLSALREAVRRA